MDKQRPEEFLKSLLDQTEIENSILSTYLKEHGEGFKIKGRQTAINAEIMRRFRIQNKKLLEQVALLKDQLKYSNTEQQNIQIEMKLLVKVNKELSAAMGSCSVCWGELPGCPECNGNGVPGWKTSHKKHFNTYVKPLLEKIQINKRRSKKLS